MIDIEDNVNEYSLECKCVECRIVYQIKPLSYYKTISKSSSGNIFVTKEGRAFRSFIFKETMFYMAENNIQCYECDLDITFSFYHDNKRKNDLDNSMKTIGDSLNETIFKDDSQIKRLKLEKFYDKKNPRIEMVIKKY